MLRFVWVNAFIALYSIVLCLCALVLSFFDRDGRKIHFHLAVPWARGILRASGIRVNATGREHVDRGTPRIYMTNHQSYFDIFALLACLPVDFKFILKQELMSIPLLGPAMRRAGYIGIERGDPRKAVKSMNDAAERIRSGASVLIFPEGTRSPDGKLQPFKKGGFNLALKSGCDIVPVTIVGSRRIVPKGSLRVTRGSFDLAIDAPIPVTGYRRSTVTQLMDKVRDVMQGRLEGRKPR